MAGGPLKDSATFCRLIVHGSEDLLVDVAVDSPPTQPPEMTVVGPTLAPAELGGRKLLALFGRAEARDLADVYLLAQRFGKPELLAQARAVDAGLEEGVLADMIGSLQRFTDEEIPIDVARVRDLRDFFAQWQGKLNDDTDEVANPEISR